MFGELFQLFGTIAINSQGAMNTLRNFENKVQGTAARLGAGAKNIGAVVSQNLMGFGTGALGVAGVLGVAAKKAMDFEEQLSSIQSLMSADEKTPENLKKLKDYALEVGAKTKYSALEAAQGMEELIKAGVDLKTVLGGGLEDALNLATAGGLNLAEAAEIMSNAVNSFKEEGLKSRDAANLLAGAANASATDVHELKYALASSAAVAGLAGQKFKDTAGALAVLAQNGLKGSDAGTSLKSMMMNLIPKTAEQFNLFEQFKLFTLDSAKALDFLSKHGMKPASNSVADITKKLREYAAQSVGAKVGSNQAEKAFRDMALAQGLMHSAFYDEKGQLKDLASMAEVLRGAFKGLTKEQQSYYLGQIFGSDGIRAAAILMKSGAEGVKKMQEDMSKVTAQQVAEEKLNNTKGAIEKLRGALETLAITIGDKLTPYIRKAAEWINKIVDRFNALSPAQQDMIIKTGLILAGIVLLLPVLGFLAGSILRIANLFRLFGSLGGGVLKFFGLFRSGANGAAQGVSMFSRIGSGIKTVFTWLGRAGGAAIRFGGMLLGAGGRIIGVIGRIIAWIFRFGNIVRIVMTVARVAMLAFSGPIGWIIAGVIALIAIIWKFRDQIGAALKRAGQWIVNFCGDVGRWFSNAWDGVVSGFRSAMNWLQDLMKPIAEWVDKWIVQPIQRAFGWIGDGIDRVKNFGGKVWNGVKNTVSGWFAEGGVFNGPQVIGVGEAGSEAVIPLKRDVLAKIGAGIGATMNVAANAGKSLKGVVIQNAAFTIKVEKLQTAEDIERMRSAIQTVVADDLFARAVRNY